MGNYFSVTYGMGRAVLNPTYIHTLVRALIEPSTDPHFTLDT